MNFGVTSSRSIEKEPPHEQKEFTLNKSSDYKGIMSRTRLSEEYLENLRLDIIRTHRKKNIKVLARTGIFASILLIIILLLI